MTPQELRKLTDDAIAIAKVEREMEIKAEQEKEAREQQEAALKAEHIIAQIPQRARTEARVGRDHAAIMGLGYDEYRDYPASGAYIRTETVDGKAAQIVWKHCQDAGFKPTLERWDDGVGIKGGYNIVIHW